VSKAAITWTRSTEHCHRCGEVRDCLVRWTMGSHKRALCRECLPLDGEVKAQVAALLEGDFDATHAASRIGARREG
jgi:hypothetical protein